MANQHLMRYSSSTQLRQDTHFMISRRHLSPGSDSRLHWHNFVEIEIVVEGEGEQILNGQTRLLRPGSLYVLRLTDYHQVMTDNGMTLYNVMFDECLISDHMQRALDEIRHDMFYQLSDEALQDMERLCELCLNENKIEHPNRRYLQNLVDCIFIRLLAQHDDMGTQRVLATPIQEAVRYLHMHFRENPSLSQTAGLVHYNASHFSSVFHKEIGTTYCSYLNTLKISYARQLLLSTELRINHICSECGFFSQSHFLHLFKVQTGVSPLKYRQLHSKKEKAPLA